MATLFDNASDSDSWSDSFYTVDGSPEHLGSFLSKPMMTASSYAESDDDDGYTISRPRGTDGHVANHHASSQPPPPSSFTAGDGGSIGKAVDAGGVGNAGPSLENATEAAFGGESVTRGKGDFDPTAEFTSEQRAAYNELREALFLHLPLDAEWRKGDLMVGQLSPRERDWCSPTTLTRYLRARKFNVEKAHAMLIATLMWRREYGIDNLSVEKIETEINNNGKMYWTGQVDLHGYPLLYMKPGHDNTTDRTTKVMYLVYLMERLTEWVDESNGISKLAIIMDFTNQAPAGPNSLRIAKDSLHILQNHYPERLGRVWMVNPTWAFSMFWKVMKALVDPETLQKITLHKLDELDGVAEGFYPDQLETDYHGSRVFTYDVDEYRRWLVSRDRARAEHLAEVDRAASAFEAQL